MCQEPLQSFGPCKASCFNSLCDTQLHPIYFVFNCCPFNGFPVNNSSRGRTSYCRHLQIPPLDWLHNFSRNKGPIGRGHTFVLDILSYPLDYREAFASSDIPNSQAFAVFADYLPNWELMRFPRST